MAKGPWSDSTDKRLLLIIITLTAPGLPKWDQVASFMGDSYTAESVRQHFQKIRKESAVEFGTQGISGPSTPRKSANKAGGAVTTPSSKSTNGKRKTDATHHFNAEDGDEASPTKRRAIKQELVCHQATVFKMEKDGGGVVDVDADDE
ncbi:hypothetical protein LTR04_005857 [Oleoguttula sp. CCFEE 6159]|nr:hypothetical protein LTR04_005857 [Oleoguttula sp. CCFEE 6159]